MIISGIAERGSFHSAEASTQSGSFRLAERTHLLGVATAPLRSIHLTSRSTRRALARAERLDCMEDLESFAEIFSVLADLLH